MPKLVKLAPNRSTDGRPQLLPQESKKRKRPIGKSHGLVTSKPLTIGKSDAYQNTNFITDRANRARNLIEPRTVE